MVPSPRPWGQLQLWQFTLHVDFGYRPQAASFSQPSLFHFGFSNKGIGVLRQIIQKNGYLVCQLMPFLRSLLCTTFCPLPSSVHLLDLAVLHSCQSSTGLITTISSLCSVLSSSHLIFFFFTCSIPFSITLLSCLPGNLLSCLWLYPSLPRRSGQLLPKGKCP